MKKIIKSRIFIVIICGIIFTSLGVYAGAKYQASEVLYNPSSGDSMTVNEALNEIYNIKTLGNATEEDIANGKTAVVQGNLVTGTYNKSSISDFKADVSITAYDYDNGRTSTLSFQYKNGKVTLTNSYYLSSADKNRYSFRINSVSITSLN